MDRVIDLVRGPRWEQLPDPFRVEILLGDDVVGMLTDRVFDDMFWFSYRVEPRSDAALDNTLWKAVTFQFRDPVTGRVCRDAYAGLGGVRDGRVRIRGMYFEGLRRWRRRTTASDRRR